MVYLSHHWRYFKMFGIGLSKVFVGLGLESMSHVALPLAYHCLLFLLIAIFLGKLLSWWHHWWQISKWWHWSDMRNFQYKTDATKMVQWQIIAFDNFIRLDNFSWNCFHVNVCIRNEMKTIVYDSSLMSNNLWVIIIASNISFQKSRDKKRKFNSRPENKSNERNELAMCSVLHTGNDFYLNHGIFCNTRNRHRHCKYRFVT